MANVVIDGGVRRGRTLANEAAFRKALADSNNVYTVRQGVWFLVGLDGDQITYTALERRPEGV